MPESRNFQPYKQQRYKIKKKNTDNNVKLQFNIYMFSLLTECLLYSAIVANMCNIPFIVLLVNGHWSTWSPWSACFCGSSQFRTRNCTDPAPMYGGQFCQGNVVEQITCTSFCYSSRYK